MLKNKFFDILLGILALLLLIGLVGVWYSFNQANQALSMKVKQQKELLAKAQTKIRDYQEWQKNKLQWEEETKKIKDFIPNKEGQDRFVAELQRLAQECKIEVLLCMLDKEPKHYKNGMPYDIYQWKVKLYGPYQGQLQFLDQLPQGERLVMVSDLEITSDTESTRGVYKVAMDSTLDLVTMKNSSGATSQKTNSQPPPTLDSSKSQSGGR